MICRRCGRDRKAFSLSSGDSGGYITGEVNRYPAASPDLCAPCWWIEAGQGLAVLALGWAVVVVVFGALIYWGAVR